MYKANKGIVVVVVVVVVVTSKARLPVKWMPPESLFFGEASTMSDV